MKNITTNEDIILGLGELFSSKGQQCLIWLKKNIQVATKVALKNLSLSARCILHCYYTGLSFMMRYSKQKSATPLNALKLNFHWSAAKRIRFLAIERNDYVLPHERAARSALIEQLLLIYSKLYPAPSVQVRNEPSLKFHNKK